MEKTAAQNDAVSRSGKEVRDVSNNRTQTQNKKREKELQQQKEQERQEKINKIIKVGLPIAALLAVFLYIKYRAYIGYYIALFAIPYGVYGLFKPYHSAQNYANKGYAVTYSRQLGGLILSLGILAIFYSALYASLNQNIWFLIALLLYMVLFFLALYLLQKRYIHKPNDK